MDLDPNPRDDQSSILAKRERKFQKAFKKIQIIEMVSEI